MLFFSWLKIKDFLKPVELSQWDNSVTVVKICFFIVFQRSGVEALVASLWCYWEVVEPSGDKA